MSGSAPRAARLAAFAEAERAGDAEAMAAAALALADGRPFGADPGRVPAFLHAAYERSAGRRRVELAVALARTWVYASRPDRAAEFAAEAERVAVTLDDPTLVAAALDASLLVHWGPDDLATRAGLAARLDVVVAHVPDVESRMSAHLWSLTTALEALDAIAVRRQVHALETLAEEAGTPRTGFYAAARRGMLALLEGDPETAQACQERAGSLGEAAGEADTVAIVHTLAAGVARQRGDRAALAGEAAVYETFGLAEGVPAVAAEAVLLWLEGGEVDRAASLLAQLAGPDFAAVPRDHDWLLVLATLGEVAARLRDEPRCRAGLELLEPYAGRGVVNAGAVAFAGVVDDVLARLASALGRADDADRWRATAGEAYRRLGATWLLGRLGAPTATAGWTAELVPGTAGTWTVGTAGTRAAVPDMRGLRYLHLLLERPGVDVPALDLAAAVAGHGGVQQADVGELVDRRAVAAYRQRIADLEAELAEAEQWADPARAARARDEHEALVAHLAQSVGVRGRQRLVGSSSERARVAVRKAIAAAIERLAEVDPALARLLRNTVRTGRVCRYEPDPTHPVQWSL